MKKSRKIPEPYLGAEECVGDEYSGCANDSWWQNHMNKKFKEELRLLRLQLCKDLWGYRRGC